MSDSVESARGRVRLLRAYDARAVTVESAVDCSLGECIVQQQFKDEVDVNTIVRRFGIPERPVVAPGGVFGDFTGIEDYQSAAARVAAVESGFMALPPEVRERFGNDPGRFAREAGELSDEGLAALVKPVQEVESGSGVGEDPAGGANPDGGA